LPENEQGASLSGWLAGQLSLAVKHVRNAAARIEHHLGLTADPRLKEPVLGASQTPRMGCGEGGYQSIFCKYERIIYEVEFQTISGSNLIWQANCDFKFAHLDNDLLRQFFGLNCANINTWP
jgi:hypothetical protein